MNNKKIIFGIVLFLAISFLAFTFANPLEKEDLEGTLIQGGNKTNNTNNEASNSIVKFTFSSDVKTKLNEGETFDLKSSITNKLEDGEILTFVTNNPDVLRVDQNGIVSATGKGSATITVTSNDGKKGSITITVSEDTTVADNNPTNNVVVNPVYTVGNNNNSNSNNSNNNNSNSGNTGSNTGNTGSQGGQNRPGIPEKPVISNVPVTNINIDTSNFTNKIIVGQTTKLGGSVEPSNATDKSVIYTSSNPSVASVDSNGNITAKGSGEATITIKSVNGVSKSVIINVIGTGSSKVSVIKNDNHFTDLDYEVVGNVIKVRGNMSNWQAAINVTITTPEILTMEDLSKFKTSIGNNDFGYTNAVGEIVVNSGNISNGYINLIVPINSSTIERAQAGLGNAQIYYNIDWLGNGNVVTYIFDFNSIVLE